MSFINQPQQIRVCNLSRNNLPSFTPIVYGLSQNKSKEKVYTIVYIIGKNFLPNGTTYVDFGDIKNIQITYYSSFNISFIVPSNATKGHYPVRVINKYSGNFSLPVQWTYPSILNHSEPTIYSIL